MSIATLNEKIRKIPTEYLNQISDYLDKLVLSIRVNEQKNNNKRVFNTLKGKCTLEFADDYKMTDEELISL